MWRPRHDPPVFFISYDANTVFPARHLYACRVRSGRGTCLLRPQRPEAAAQHQESVSHADSHRGIQVSRRIASITLDNLDDLPRRCRKCVFWELDPVSRTRADETGSPELEKESWISSTLLEWGSCGKIVYVDSVPAGYVLYAPPLYVPRSVAFPTSPVSADAVLLMTAHVLDEFAGGGLGRVLVQTVAKDLTRRGVKAIEAFGDLKWEQPGCVLPAGYLLAVGFKTVRPHLRYPRLRLELKTALSWREDVEVALERLLRTMTPERALRPI